MVGTTRSRVGFFMNKFRKPGFIDYNRELHVHSSLLNIVRHDAVPLLLVIVARKQRQAAHCHQSLPLSNFDQIAAGLLAIMASKRGGLEMTGTDRYEHGDITISHRRETS